MALPGLDSGVRVPYKSCGEIRREPGRIFEWRQGNEHAPSSRVAKRSCIFVLHNATGEKLPLRPSMTSTLGSVKEEVSKLVMIPASHIRLSWRGHVLEDTRTLVSYGISNGHCIHFSCCRSATTETEGQPSPRRLMPLTICMVDDSDRPMLARLRVLARIYDKVLDVKLLLETQTGIDAGDMRLTIGGKTLPNENTLIECGVRDESATLNLICVFGTQDMTSVELQRNAHLAVPGTAIETLEFSVIVKQVWPAGRCRHVGLTTDSTIRSLKEQLREWSGIEPEKQMLLHRGRVLVDDLTASYYNLTGGAHLDLALVGGMKPKPMVRPVLHPGPSSPNKRRTVSNAGHANENCSSAPKSKQVVLKIDPKEIESLADAPAIVGDSFVAPSVPEAREQLIVVRDSSSEIHIAIPLHPLTTESPNVNLAAELDVSGVAIEASEISMRPSEEAHLAHPAQPREEVIADPSTPFEHIADQEQGIEEQMSTPKDGTNCMDVTSNEIEATCANSVGSLALNTAEKVSTPPNVADVVGDSSLKSVVTEPSEVGEVITQIDVANESEMVTENGLPTTSLSRSFDVEMGNPSNESVAASNTACSGMIGGVNIIETGQEEVMLEEASLSRDMVEAHSSSPPTNLAETQPDGTVAPLSSKSLVEKRVAPSSTNLVDAPSSSPSTSLVEDRPDETAALAFPTNVVEEEHVAPLSSTNLVEEPSSLPSTNLVEHRPDDTAAPSFPTNLAEEHVTPLSRTNLVEAPSLSPSSNLAEDQPDDTVAPSSSTNLVEELITPSSSTKLVEAPSSPSPTNMVENRPDDTAGEPSMKINSKHLSPANLAEDDLLSQSSTEVVGIAEGNIENAE